MRKYAILVTLTAVMLFAFTACGGNETQTIQQPDQTLTLEVEDNQVGQDPAHNNNGIFYQFDDLGFSFMLPSSWEGKYGIERAFDFGVNIYHIATREEFGNPLSGFLFQIWRLDDYAFEAAETLGFSTVLGQAGGYTYIISYPVDDETRNSVSEAAVQYREMMEYLKGYNNFIVNNIRLIQTDLTSTTDAYEVQDLNQHANPFAAPLLEYLDGSVENPDAISAGGYSAYSNLIDIDGNGTIGVLALRSEEPYGWPIFYGKVFYLNNGELLYLDLGALEGFPYAVSLTAENRLVLVTGDGGQWSYTLFGIDNGRLVGTLTLYGEMADGYSYNYFYYRGGRSEGWEIRIPITEAEFDEMRIRYGLDNLAGLRRDETDAILVMTFE